MNPRYLAYCRETGESDPERALKRDDERYPGGRMTGFILWVSERWREWEKENKRRGWDHKNDADHTAFDRWLAEREPEPSTLEPAPASPRNAQLNMLDLLGAA